jgi:hypothetical protein
MQHARLNRLRRAVSYIVLAAALGVVSFTLTQCTLVDSTGVGLDRNAPTTCIKACNDAAQAAREQCKRDHETARELCAGDPDCLLQADAARDECNAAANAAKEECQDNCAHHQGSGSAG